MKAKELQPGQEFKTKRLRKWRTVKRVIVNSSLILLKGKVLIILENNCQQLALFENEEVTLK